MNTEHRWWSAFLFIWTIFVRSFFLTPVYAAETICPGGVSHRSDIQWCVDFEDTTHCITGQETQCQNDNGIDLLVNSLKDFKILPCLVTPAIGSGCAFGSGIASGTGPGYSSKTFSPSTAAANVRWYVRFGKGFMQNESNTGDHSVAFIYQQPGGNCQGYISLDYTLSHLRVIIEPNNTACGGHNPDGGNLTANLGDVDLKNDRWHVFEMRAILNTTASGTGVNQGNGTVELWFDETKILSYNNVNMRGDSTTSKIDSMFLARDYFGFGVPRQEPIVFYDGIAFSNNATYIGRSVNENALGTADTLSPYWYAAAGDGAEQRKLSGDCSQTGSATRYNSTGWSDDWRDGKSYTSTPNHNEYSCQPDCVGSGCITTNSLVASTSALNHGAGVTHLMSNINSVNSHHLFIHEWTYLPSSNSYATTFPWSGYSRYCSNSGGANNWGCYFAVGVSGGNWAFVSKNNGTVNPDIVSAIPYTLDTWHEIEVAVSRDNECSLWVDDRWAIDDVPCTADIASWAFDVVSTGENHGVIGLIDGSPSSPFTRYIDDYDVGGASFVSCKGWGTSCPFNIIANELFGLPRSRLIRR